MHAQVLLHVNQHKKIKMASFTDSNNIIGAKFKLNGCIVWNEHNTVFGSKRSAICAQAVYFLHSTMPDVTCLRLSDVSVICRVTYFQFQIQSAFLSWRSARQHSGVLVVQPRGMILN